MKYMTEATARSAAHSTGASIYQTGVSVVAAIALVATASVPGQAQSSRSPEEARFACQLINGQYTVTYRPESRPNEAFPWAVPSTLGGGWTADRRCIEISRRLEEYRPDGLLELETGRENGYNIVCVTTQENDDCRIVFTVPPGQDPLLTRDLVFQNLTIADNGEMTQGVNTYSAQGNTQIDKLVNLGMSLLNGQRSNAGSRATIPLRPFLDAADGGTGQHLKDGIRQPSGPRLNPGKFR